jgi:hypothetical protein
MIRIITKSLEDLVFPMYLLLLPIVLAYGLFLIFGPIETIKSNDHSDTIVRKEQQKSETMKEGLVIEKNHKNSSTYFVTNYIDNVPILAPITDPERFILTIYGKENGKKIEKKIDVSEKEYNSFKVGDTYKFK